ncbi:aromatic ring-hydroxylating dioxygenase subunit alpha [Pseudomonas sp. SA3-5]|uniref:Aromatic ring-hydroxylating dioxygenase subunit alpha n=1 Tax=Pseudomonas aestuarii TaxID=3018340 RepID=A0ABT4XM16_9PSED|nr:aromatic ring-hydroxylating dioxygenase subunit alpha [Pseudomonas aestuarii]MDA7089205.1 aromatic ring-hydroxylating dioxygenase subunit alpha [Pseudomonas aestuarii]
MNYLRNTWYMAAWSEELAEGALFNRTLLGESILFYRKTDTSVAAISNRCPHRFAPLHMGTLQGDCVRCPYHGLTFHSAGKCSHNPHGDGRIPKAAQVKAYPVIEQHLAVWIWMGDTDKADTSLIPGYAFLSAAKPTARNLGYLHTLSDYQLLTDNIMDLSHVDFLHPDTLGGGALSRVGAKLSELDGNRLRILWEAFDEVAPPAFAPHLPDPQALADVWTDVVWSPPASMYLSTGVAPAGGSDELAVTSANLHVMTPESENTTHYFYANTRSFLQDDIEYNRMLNEMLVGIFAGEDKPIVEAQQRLMGSDDFWSLKPILLAGDAGAVRARRILAGMIEQEQQAD